MCQTKPSPGTPAGNRSDRCCRVVWVRGEHDVGTASWLSDELQHIIELDDADIILDLSSVTFMDASTVGVFRRAQAAVTAPWILEMRNPSKCAARVLALCDITLPPPAGAPCRAAGSGARGPI